MHQIKQLVGVTMNIKNPFIKGTVAFQNFNNDILANKHLPISQLLEKEKTAIDKKDDYLNNSDSQRTAFEYHALALNALIIHKQGN
jgi:hypothetical protein